jgi:ataxin-10
MGVRICVHLLDNMLRLFEDGEGTEGAQAFDLGFAVFVDLF